MSVISLPKSNRHEARERIAELANESTGKVYLSDHCRMRMQERNITIKQVINVLRRGDIVGDVMWDVKVESCWKMTIKAIRDLQKIEDRQSSWKSKFAREMEIWEDIAMQINSTKGEEKEHWEVVMDLYNKKYRQETHDHLISKGHKGLY